MRTRPCPGGRYCHRERQQYSVRAAPWAALAAAAAGKEQAAAAVAAKNKYKKYLIPYSLYKTNYNLPECEGERIILKMNIKSTII